MVPPAPGQPARLPFWRGDSVGRPAELGKVLRVGSVHRRAGRPGSATTSRCAAGKRARRPPLTTCGSRSTSSARPPGWCFTDATPGGGALPFIRTYSADYPAISRTGCGTRPLALAVSRRLHERYGIDEKTHRLTTASSCATARHRRSAAGAGHFRCSTPTRSSRSSPPRCGGSASIASRFREQRGAGATAPRAIPASVHRCGINANAPRNCSISRASTDFPHRAGETVRNARRTFMTCRR